MVFLVERYKGYFNYKAYSKQALEKPRILSFVLYIPIPTPPVLGRVAMSQVWALSPLDGVKVIENLPPCSVTKSLHLY